MKHLYLFIGDPATGKSILARKFTKDIEVIDDFVAVYDAKKVIRLLIKDPKDRIIITSDVNGMKKFVRLLCCDEIKENYLVTACMFGRLNDGRNKNDEPPMA